MNDRYTNSWRNGGGRIHVNLMPKEFDRIKRQPWRWRTEQIVLAQRPIPANNMPGLSAVFEQENAELHSPQDTVRRDVH